MAEVTDNKDASRYELVEDGKVAGFIEYSLSGDRISLDHTEVGDEYGGRGFAKELAVAALDDIRSRGSQVLPVCPFVAGYIQKHPEYADLVPAEEHERFGLG